MSSFETTSLKAEATRTTLEKVETTPVSNDSDTHSLLLWLFSLVQRRRNQPLADSKPLPTYDPISTVQQSSSAEKTVLYLAYGSNMAASTFQGNRGVRPLSAVNVVVPDLEVVFDLAGLAYVEPCFANSRFRSEKAVPTELLESVPASEQDSLLTDSVSSHNNLSATALGWKKGMVGVVYEVTQEDYAHIIATEGGDSSYADIEISCYPLARNGDIVPSDPRGPSFKVHTLFAKGENNGRGKRREGWAQPSKRYLSLLTTGSQEHEFPSEYRKWLATLKPYTISTWRQKVGKFLFLLTWMPWVLGSFGLARANTDQKGRAPRWSQWLTLKIFMVMWISHDYIFKPLFGDGERTIER